MKNFNNYKKIDGKNGKIIDTNIYYRWPSTLFKTWRTIAAIPSFATP